VKDAKGHGSDSKGGASDPEATVARLRAGIKPNLSRVTKAPSWVAAHQTGVSKIGKAAKIGAALYVAQAAAGVAGGVGWALWHSFGGG
jgi:hypothetical protein